MLDITMQPTFRRAAAIALALGFVGFGSEAALAGGKSPPPAFDVTFDNIQTEFFALKVTLPKVEIKGSSLAKADIEKIFAKETPIADRIKAMTAYSAGSAEIPAVNFSLNVGPAKVEGAYNGTKLEKIAGGKIGKYSGSGVTFAYKVGDIMSAAGSIKNIVYNDINFVHWYRLWEDKAGPEDKDAVALMGASVVEGLTVDINAPDFSAKGGYGKLTSATGTKIKLLSRPLKETLSEGIEAATALLGESSKDPAKLEQARKVGLSLIELAENYRMGAVSLEDYTFSETIKDPKAGGPITVSFKVAKGEISDNGLLYSDISFNGGPATGKASSFSLRNFSLAPFLATAKTVLSAPIETITEEQAKRLALSLYSNFGTLDLNDFDITVTGIEKKAPTAVIDDEEGEDDTPQAQTPAPQAAPEKIDVNVKFKGLTLKLEKAVNGIPSSFRMALQNLRMPTVLFSVNGKASDIKTYESLKQLGIETLDLSYAFDLDWNKDANELAIREISGAEASFGSFIFKGNLGNFTEKMFTTDKKVLAAAAMGLTAKDVSLHVEDKGGLDKAIKLAAQEQGVKPEALKAMVPLSLAMIPEPLASLPSVATVKDAFLKYWENPGKLDIAIKAKNGMGLGIADFAAVSMDPTSLDAKIEVKATATK